MKRCLAFLLLLALLLTQFVSYAAAPKLEAKAYILVDANTGKILFEQNAESVLVPASMTKLMTMYLVLESVAIGQVSWTDDIKISEYANKISKQPSLSSYQLATGAVFSLRELFYMTALNSSNPGAIAIAEHIAGSEGAFVTRMNAKARAFGLSDVKFVNSSGLNNADLFGYHPEFTAQNEDNKLSARSMATIAFRLLNDYPEYTEYSSLPQKTIREGQPGQLVINSTNKLLPGRQFGVEGVRGLKTGYTFNAGFCFAGYAVRKSGRFISIVMGAVTTEERFRGSGRLLEYGFGLAEGREESSLEQARAFLYPDKLKYYEKRALTENGVGVGTGVGTDGGAAAGSGAGEALYTFGDVGFGIMENGKSDVLIVDGRLYNVTRRGRAAQLMDASGVGSAALTYFNRDGQVELTGARDLAGLERALTQSVEGTDGASYCFKITGAVTPARITSVSNPETEAEARFGSGSGVVIGFWNHASENDILRHGYTFYYLDADLRFGGLLLEADFGDVDVQIDRMEPLEAFFDRGEEITIQ
jgi:D-alanyl-D-alanine carboxypeptidase/alpha-acetolactate decarboxylase